MLRARATSIGCLCTFTMEGSRWSTAFVSCVRKMLRWEILKCFINMYALFFSSASETGLTAFCINSYYHLSFTDAHNVFSGGDLGNSTHASSLFRSAQLSGATSLDSFPETPFMLMVSCLDPISLHTHCGFSSSLIFLCWRAQCDTSFLELYQLPFGIFSNSAICFETNGPWTKEMLM